MIKERENSEVLENQTEQISKDPKYREIETSREDNSKGDTESLIYNKRSSKRETKKERDKIYKIQLLKK